MLIDELWNMPLKEVLDKYCVVYSPECGYYYGITTWDEALQMEEEYDLEDEYCFAADYLIPIEYGVEDGEEILNLKYLNQIMARLGIAKKEPCPQCGSQNYHFDYNEGHMTCGECGHQGEPKYEEIEEDYNNN